MAEPNDPMPAPGGVDAALEDTGARLIAGSKVAGTAVYAMDGEHLGEVADVMIEKRSGRIAYAVLRFGGFLGLGGDYHPLPWGHLRYDTARGGFVVNVDRNRLQGAPSYGADAAPWGDEGWGRSVDDFYKDSPAWSGVR